jgi:translation initiation factor IF-2
VLPSQPVRIIGFKSLPKAGDPIICVESEEKAELLIERRAALGIPDQNMRTADEGPSTLEVMGVNAQHRKLQMIYDKYNMDQNAVATTIRIPVLLKADADGTLAALRESIVAIGNESSLDIVIDPIGLGIGTVTTSDVSMAKDSNAAIFSFNVKQNDKEAISFLESEGVVWKSSNVIYTILDAAKEVFAKYLPSTTVEHVHGKAVVQAVFEITKGKARERIAGLKVMNGNLFLEKASVLGTSLNCHYRVIRNGEMVSGEGEVVTAASLRKVKEDVQEVRNGDECGLGLSGFEDFQNGDVIECYSMESKNEFV